MRQLLITGGAGFIGAHLTEEMLQHGYRVRVLDNLSSQVHGAGRKRPPYLTPQAELIVGDIRDPEWNRFNMFRSVTRIPGGELMLDVQARAIHPMKELRERHVDHTIALIRATVT